MSSRYTPIGDGDGRFGNDDISLSEIESRYASPKFTTSPSADRAPEIGLGSPRASNVAHQSAQIRNRLRVPTDLSTYREEQEASLRVPKEPLQDLESFYPFINPDTQKGLGRFFFQQKQLWRLLSGGATRWLISAALIAMIYVTLRLYSNMAVMSDSQKHIFNFLAIALSLALGLNMASSLKAMAIDLRWWILSQRRRSLEEVDLILHCDSLVTLAKLALVAPRPMVILVTLLWLALNIAAQGGVAMIGLTYSVDTATARTLLNAGNVSIADLSAFYPGTTNDQMPSFGTGEFIANTYGSAALSLSIGDVSKVPDPGTTWSTRPADYWRAPKYWQYVFKESPAGARSSALSVVTDRSIQSSWSCTSWSVRLPSGNGSYLYVYVNYDGGSSDVSEYVPLTGPERTTYFTNPDPCGPRCTTVTAFEASYISPFYYQCNITVGNVTNAAVPQHQVSDTVAATAAGAIALQGYRELVYNTSYYNAQYRLYPNDSYYGAPQSGKADAMGQLMAQYAIGAIAVADSFNPSVNISGLEPQDGVTLNVTSDQWRYLYLILGFMAGGQLVLFIVTAFVANRVVVTDESHLAVARLLRPIVDRLGSSGSMLSGKEISRALQDKGHPMEVAYSVKVSPEGEWHHIDMGVQKVRRAFPRGWYD